MPDGVPDLLLGLGLGDLQGAGGRGGQQAVLVALPPLAAAGHGRHRGQRRLGQLLGEDGVRCRAGLAELSLSRSIKRASEAVLSSLGGRGNPLQGKHYNTQWCSACEEVGT